MRGFGLVVLGLSAERAPAAAQSVPYRAASEAPAAWRDYAQRLQGVFQQQVDADTETSRWIAEYAAGRERDGKSMAYVVSATILPDGKIDRVAFDGMAPELADRVRPLLASANAGAPPADMLQPLRLRLQLRHTE